LVLQGRKLAFIYLLVLGVSLFFADAVAAIEVRPLVLELNVRPGDVRDFEIALLPGLTEEIVDLTLYEPVQQLSGALAYQLPENPAFSATSWVNLERNVVRVYPDEEAKVTGRVTVPFSASGSHTVIIMVEPRPPEITAGISLQVRYAVRLSIRVERPGQRQVADLDEFSLQPGDRGQPVVRTVLKNPSPWDYLVEGEATIRDADGRLVERIALVSPATRGSEQQALRLYPGARVEFLGEVTKRLQPGDYSLRIYFRYGDHGQIIKNETISIAEGDFIFPNADELGVFSIAPEAIEYAAKPGERKSQVLEFLSETADSVRMVVEPRPVAVDYPYSLSDWLQLRMSGNEFELPGRRNTRLGLTIAIPRDVADGSYHGTIVVQALDPVTSKLLTEKLIPVTVVVGEEHKKSVEVRNLVAAQGELVLDLFNAGNVFISPRGEALIIDSRGESVARVVLTLPDGERGIVPLGRQRLEGRTPILEPGLYQVEISIKDGVSDLLVVTRELQVF